jgi:hypothetical protein
LFQFLQAGQYVCGSNKEYMEKMADFVKWPELEKMLPSLKASLFGPFS